MITAGTRVEILVGRRDGAQWETGATLPDDPWAVMFRNGEPRHAVQLDSGAVIFGVRESQMRIIVSEERRA